MIPKIIHQTWKTEEVPIEWEESRASWQRFHPDWQYMFWTDRDLERFITKRYQWFTGIYRDYPYAIQRIDAARYFILYEYGGIYSDLDIICKRNCDFLLSHAAIIPKTEPLGFSNDLMLVEPKHPFFLQMIANLAKAHRKFSQNLLLLRHFRVML
jgi:mannosyltransferase OCH1-like enzyme